MQWQIFNDYGCVYSVFLSRRQTLLATSYVSSLLADVRGVEIAFLPTHRDRHVLLITLQSHVDSPLFISLNSHVLGGWE